MQVKRTLSQQIWNDPEYLPRRREYMREYMREYFKRNPEKYELQKARTRNYRRKNI